MPQRTCITEREIGLEQSRTHEEDLANTSRFIGPSARCASSVNLGCSSLPHSQVRAARSVGLGHLVSVRPSVDHLPSAAAGHTHGFFAFKGWLCGKYAELRGKAKDGLVSRGEWLKVSQAAKAEFFDVKSWLKSFSATGARMPCAQLTKALSKYANPRDTQSGEAAEPGVQELSWVWPKNRKMEFASPVLFPKQDDQPAQPPRQASAVKRSLPAEPAMSIALASRSLKRA